MPQGTVPRACPGRLAGRITVVTDAASGIGRATAIRLAEEGASVVALDLDPRVAATAEAIASAGFQASSEVLDCASRPDVERAFAGIEQRSGRVDILVNAVGRSARERMGTFADSDPKVWDMVVRLSLCSTMLCARQVVPGMRARRAGRIVNISSVAWFVPTPFFSEYAAAKAGVVGFTRVLAVEMAAFGVTVNAISPGPILTPALASQPPGVQERIKATIPLGGYGTPEDVAAGAAYLVSDDGRFVTGHNLVVSGGRGMV